MSFRPGISRVSIFGADEQPVIKVPYRYASSGNVPAATPTDIMVLTGSATKVIRVRRVRVGGLATTAGSMIPTLIRRSTANLTGTKTSPVPLQMDKSDAVPTATLDLYTVNPGTLGTVVGNFGAKRLLLGLVAVANDWQEWVWDPLTSKGLVLRGILDSLAINFGGAAVPAGGTLDFEWEFTEE